MLLHGCHSCALESHTAGKVPRWGLAFPHQEEVVTGDRGELAGARKKSRRVTKEYKGAEASVLRQAPFLVSLVGRRSEEAGTSRYMVAKGQKQSKGWPRERSNDASLSWWMSASWTHPDHSSWAWGRPTHSPVFVRLTARNAPQAKA